METQNNSGAAGNQKRVINLLLVIIVILVGLSGFLGYKLYNTTAQIALVVADKNEADIERNALMTELDSLRAEHDRIKTEYGELNDQLLAKDSLIQANIKEIEGLLASKVELNQIKRKMKRLREITQTYVHQIDSLFTVNNQLKDDLTEVTSSYNKEKQRTEQLTKVSNDLTDKVTTAAVMKVFKVKGTPMKMRRDKEILVEKAKKTEQIKISFTVLENSLIESGPKNLYVRIADPSGAILTNGKNDDAHSFNYNGQRLQFSVKKQINYEQKNQEVEFFWTQSAEFSVGMYTIDVFTEDQLMGTGKFSLE
ncbi:MAG: hypothetical protein KKA07_00790 [Bacteroidetes bacterium]|nr:hypothetical protein [Bacteroidota bacterium]MBU1717586.1 hypothetical protein [Bacteroidota bacterium]